MSRKYVEDYLLFDTQDCLFIHDGIFVQKHSLLEYVKYNTIWMKSILISENMLYNYAKYFKSFKYLSIVHQCLGTDRKNLNHLYTNFIFSQRIILRCERR